MISKERLGELIKKEAVVFVIDYCNNNVKRIRLGDSVPYFIENGNVFCYPFGNCTLDKIFETKEDAEWHKEFGCIERTEKLELPAWEKIERFINDVIVINCFTTKNREFISMWLKRGKILIQVLHSGTPKIIGEWEATKENYMLACRKCKELFLGD